MTDLVAVKWTDGTGRVRWGVDGPRGSVLMTARYNELVFGTPWNEAIYPPARFRTRRQALRAARRALRPQLQRTWTRD